MDTALLGATGIRVVRIALGTVKLGRNTGVKYPKGFELPTDEEVDRLLDGAVALGVDLLDTAPAYGSSEERLGRWLQQRSAAVRVCTKVGEDFDGERSHHDWSAGGIERSVMRSRERLGRECLDLVLLHSDGSDLEILRDTPAVATLRRLQRRGLVRAIGISAKTAAGIAEAARTLDVVMAPVSLAQPELEGALAAAHARGAGILAIKALGSGHLEPGDALRHVLALPFVDAIVLGTLTLDHLAFAVAAADAAGRDRASGEP
jgi:aryl-alcohol dehydrogenase-like predicted oxidoreductase